MIEDGSTADDRAPVSPGFAEAFRFWLKLGFISFGGPAGQIAIMHEYIVEKKKWVSESRFLHALNYCMALPGPEAQQLATYLGWLLHGVRGGLTAGILFILPSAAILLGLCITYVSFGNLVLADFIFSGLKPAIVAIIVVALIRIGRKALAGRVHYTFAAVSFIAMAFLNIPFPAIIAAVVVIALLVYFVNPGLIRTNDKNIAGGAEENDYIINDQTGYRASSPGRAVLQCAIAAVLWFLPVVLLFLFHNHFDFWLRLILFFSKAALVTFGGAYAVLPYVAQVSVEEFHWLTAGEMVDGLALGESTPGPLIMVLVFVGFIAGYRNSLSLWGGTLGLFITAYYTFLPSFLFILIGAPFIERTKHNPTVKAVLGLVSAAVVGVILNLVMYFGRSVLFLSGMKPDWPALCWLLISFYALYFKKVKMLQWIVFSAVAGIIAGMLM